MKIRYTEFALNPSLRNTFAHLPAHRAQALIDSGAAVEVPMAPRGSAGWLADMKERSAAMNPAPAEPATVTFSIVKGAVSERYAVVAKCSRSNCAQFYFDADPDLRAHGRFVLEHLEFVHCCGATTSESIPRSVCDQYRKLFRPATKLGRDEAAYYVDARPQPSKPVDLNSWSYPLTGPLREGNEKDALQNFLPDPGDNQPLDPKFYKWK